MQDMMRQMQEMQAQLAAYHQHNAHPSSPKAHRAPTPMARQPAVAQHPDPGVEELNNMKFDCRAVITEWQENGTVAYGTAQTIGHAQRSKIAKHVESRHPTIPSRLIRAYITNRLSHLKNKGEGPGRWKYKNNAEFPDGYFVRHNEPADKYRLNIRSEWPTVEETEAVIAFVMACANGIIPTEGPAHDAFYDVQGATVPDNLGQEKKVVVKTEGNPKVAPKVVPASTGPIHCSLNVTGLRVPDGYAEVYISFVVEGEGKDMHPVERLMALHEEGIDAVLECVNNKVMSKEVLEHLPSSLRESKAVCW
ncbi:hypothetical protein CYMTET_12252 [Cymbomonas tetramitiformis]|uniref:Uncharacterized protein n=1 Tax=Cymbomonas tetramitiformis TaxID=36881 RepID=A0AAE0LCC2_9CHLO|nr:hypothetical protein CYMTET_12252 [Cymbomonas tetramitiformis]